MTAWTWFLLTIPKEVFLIPLILLHNQVGRKAENMGVGQKRKHDESYVLEY
jgi:hypothetical protein